MKLVLRIFGVFCGVVLVVFFIGNQCVRVSDGSGESYGIFEQLLLDNVYTIMRPPWSENYKRWNAAIKGSQEIADLINRYGKSIIEDDRLDEKRLQAAETSKKAYKFAKNVDLEYLRKSNQELPEMFSKHLTNALCQWSEGLAEKNGDKILEGIQSYNNYLQWIQSKGKNDFKPLR